MGIFRRDTQIPGIDNFPASVVGTDPLNPILTRGFLEYAQHRGFIPDPARAGNPQDKLKVERKVPYARERFFKGADFDDFPHVRAAAPRWCLEVAGQRIHGTTRKKPLVVFQDEERHTLLPWDGVPYEIAHWRTNTVHRNFHIQCLDALYSVPSHLCRPGQKVEVSVDSKLVRIYHRGQLIKTHVRQPAGGRSTDPDDYPALDFKRRKRMKANQGELHENIKDLFKCQEHAGWDSVAYSHHEQLDKDHGRRERRQCRVITDPEELA